ncbi:hypothetical protein QUF50_04485 [Thiotrichales bacterium HSG1]|nr:hypothetical protein [Thiotrichales bacterium HSG1]
MLHSIPETNIQLAMVGNRNSLCATVTCVVTQVKLGLIYEYGDHN